MRLCFASGLVYRDPDELWSSLSPQQWEQWRAFAAIEPLGSLAIGHGFAWMGNLIAATRGVEITIPDALTSLGYAAIPTGPPPPLTIDEERALIEAAVRSRG